MFKNVFLQIAITNNCSSLTEMTLKFRQEYRKENSLVDAEAEKVFESALLAFRKLREDRYVGIV